MSAQSYLALGRPELAAQTCESPATPFDEDDRHFCLALAYRALGKTKQAANELEELTVWPDGSAIELQRREIQFGVHEVMIAVLP